MPEVDRFINDFQRRVDKHAMPTGSLVGERGVITKIMYNGDYGIHYYLHYIRAWFHKFGIIFRNNIPAQDINSEGTSVPMTELRHAMSRGNAYIVEIRDDPITFYGCHVREWFDYVTSYDTKHIKREVDNIMEGCIPIRLLWDMEGFKNK